MRRLLVCVAWILFAFLAAAPRVASAESAPTVRIPDGFVDLAHAIPADLEGRLPARLDREARSGGHLVYAFDFDHAEGGSAPNLIADLRDGSLPDDAKKLSEVPTALVDALRQMYPAASPTLVDTSTTVVAGHKGLRVVIDASYEARSLRQLLYVLPAGSKMLVLTYSASQAAYPDYEPRFDASAQATTGLQAAPAAFRVCRSG